MLTRRSFGQALAGVMAGAHLWSESALAQRALIGAPPPGDVVWINANENPEGPGPVAIEAMTAVLAESGRYHYLEMRDFYAAVAKSVGLEANQVLVGAGSSEILHAAIDAFTSPTRPLIVAHPTYELPGYVAEAAGRNVIRVPLTATYASDVKEMAAAAAKAGGGLLYVCNPNNPTASMTPKAEIDWLISNLPQDTVVLIDEAYIHFEPNPDEVTALAHVRQGRNVIVVRTFSKIYGMAGLRVGFGCAKADYISRMLAFRNNVISIVGARAALGALGQGPEWLAQRREKLTRIRGDVCAWLRSKGIGYIEPHANFMMIEIGRDPRDFALAMLKKGVAVGRPFPPLNQMLRVSMGTEKDMARFKEVFWETYQS